MTRTPVTAHGRDYLVNELEPRARGAIFQVVVMARMMDAVTGAPVGNVRVGTRVPGLGARRTDDGFAGLVGIPNRVFPALNGTPYDVDVQFEAMGYASRAESVTLAAQAGFPAQFSPARLGNLVMHRDPVSVAVGTYVLDAAFRPVPLAGANVSLTGFWSSVDELSGAATTTPLLAVGPGLSARRPAGATVAVAPVAPFVEAPRVLTRSVQAGSARVGVSNTGGLVVGSVVGFDAAAQDRAEYVEVVGIDGPADQSAPAELDLRFPVTVPHSAGAPVIRTTAASGATAATLTAEALAGDWTVRVTALGGLPAGAVVKITGGASSPEYRMSARYRATTNGVGAGRFPPMSGIAAIRVFAIQGGVAATDQLTLTQQSPRTDLTLT